MKLHWHGLATFGVFAVVLMLAVNPRYGIVALGAWLIIEALLWSGVLGFGRDRS